MATDAAPNGAQVKSEMAYEMVLALLEHQLSSPVQWIATQDSLLDMAKQHQRYVEIGPSNTLSTMMKKTMAQGGAQTGHTLSDNLDGPECFTYADELEAIRKASEPDPEEEDEEETADAAAESAPAPVPVPIAAPVAAPVVQAASVSELEDVPPTASDALVTIVASGLKIAPSTVDVTQSIKFLAKGRSALQNEIVGNLSAEFGQVPEAVETTPISELCQVLQRTHSGKLGAYLGEWLTKRVSAKLAPSISVSKLRARLRSQFGLKQGHQDSFFLSINFDDIASRLTDEQESWKTVHQWADSYMRSRGLQRMEQAQVQQQQLGGQSQAGAQTSSPQLAKFASELAMLMSKHFDDPSADEPAESDPESASSEDIGAAKHLAAELGPEFIAGTRSYFRPEKVYKYQSAWNWAVQDLHVTLMGLGMRMGAVQMGNLSEEELGLWIEEQGERMRARRTERVLQCAKYLLQKWEKENESEAAMTPACPVPLLLRAIVRDDEPTSVRALKSYAAPSRKTIPKTTITDDGELLYSELPAEATIVNHRASVSEQSSSYDSCGDTPNSEDGQETPNALWPIRLLTKGTDGEWETNNVLTSQLHEAERNLGMDKALPVEGTTLIIGAGQRSIGFMLARQLLQAGHRVAMCTGRLTPENRKIVSKMYATYAKPGAELVLLPFNQGSVQDVHNLVNYINDTLGWEIDHLVPFAAISTNGKNIEDVDSVSELALRIMLTNTLRLMGSIVASKRRRNILNHSTQVLVPLSPNHGQFGNDGLYAESKLALEALLNKAASEPWGDSLAICGVRMGWARGTGLMATNDVFAESLEKLGARTFSAEEMATLLALVMTPDLTEACIMEPVVCDFTGGLGAIPDMGSQIMKIRSSIQDKVAARKLLKKEAEHDEKLLSSRVKSAPALAPTEIRAKMHNSFPVLPESHASAIPETAPDLKDLYNLDSMVVITGFGELGSAGSSRTRWELEAEGEFSIEGCIELAWMMGFIKYEKSRLHNGTDTGPGWVVIESGAPIKDLDVKAQFEARIREHTGIRILETDTDPYCNPDPRLRDMLHEVGTQEDLPPFDCSSAAAEDLKRRHGDAIEVLSDDGSSASVRIRSGASIFVPKAMNTAYFVGAQVPQGWDAARYGIPQEVSAQTDRPGLFALVCCVEAFLSAGITDVYELYRYIHVSEVGNCIGSGAGGLPAFQRMHEHRLLGREVPNDNLSEAFVGTAAAWLNLLLLSSSGPIKTGAGTCATSLESMDTACDLIQAGKTKICLAGGYDVFTRPIYYEFGEINAIIDAAKDEQHGRAPKEMSRPFTSTRSGFVLGEGIGIQVLASASLALEMGLPIYGIVAMTHMASDKLGRSAPAPGRGILTAAKQPKTLSGGAKGLMNPSLRSKLVKTAISDIEARSKAQIEALGTEALATEEAEACIQSLQAAAALEKKAVRRALGQDYWKSNPEMSPITGSLSVFGLTVDDITFASLHGTATKLNDVNEAATLDHEMRHLGRTAGNPLFTIAQKSVIGHGLGASGAYAINGGLQAMHAGVIPGNANADDIDVELAAYENLLLTNEKVMLRPQDFKAFSVTSFGFGQKGAQVLIVHPQYLFAALTEEEYGVYRSKQVRRSRLANRELDRGLHGQALFKAKEELPYVGDEYEFMLDPSARRE